MFMAFDVFFRLMAARLIVTWCSRGVVVSFFFLHVRCAIELM